MYARSLLLFVGLFCFTQTSNAGFIIKKPAAVSAMVVTAAGSDAAVNNYISGNEGDSTRRFYRPVPQHHHHSDHAHHEAAGTRSSWAGIVSFVLALTVYFSVPAIIFGIVGMQKGRRKRGLAKAGFIIGLVNTAIMAAVVALVLASI